MVPTSSKNARNNLRSEFTGWNFANLREHSLRVVFNSKKNWQMTIWSKKHQNVVFRKKKWEATRLIPKLEKQVCRYNLLTCNLLKENDNMVKKNTKMYFSWKKSLRSYMPHTKVGKTKCSDIIYSNLINLITYNHI